MADSGLSIGVLSGKLDLDAGTFKSEIVLSVSALDELEKRFGGAGSSAAKMAGSFVVAEAAIAAVKEVAHLAADEIATLSVQGARVADVEDNFKRLTLAAGQLSDELLNNLKKGTHDTLTDFELMKAVNDNLAAGVKLTAEQYNTLATGAFALAQAKGIEVKQAFDDINFALETGKVKTVQYLTGKLDLADAEDKYAKSLGTSADRLSAEEKQQAARLVIIDKVSQSIKRLGDQQDGLDEKVAQARVGWQNFEEDLGKTIARSPVVLKAFDDIKQILTDAFGGDREEAIKRIVAGVEDLAKAGVEAVRVGVDIVKFMYEWRGVIEPVAVGLGTLVVGLTAIAAAEKAVVVVKGLEIAFAAMAPELLVVAAGAAAVYAAFEVGKWQPVSDFFEKLGLEVFYGMSSAEADATVASHHLNEEMATAAKEAEKQADALAKTTMSTAEWKAQIETIDPILDKYGRQLLESGKNVRTVADETGLSVLQVRALEYEMVAAAKSTDDFDKSNTTMINGVRLSRQEFKQYLDSWSELNTLGSTYKDTLAGVNPGILQSVQYYAQLGASVNELTKAFPGLTAEQAKAAVEGVKAAQDLQKINTETFAIIAKGHGDNVNDWLRLEKMKYDQTVQVLTTTGRATAEALDAELAKFRATVDAEMQKREEQIPNSKAFYQKQYDDAKNTLDLMLSDETAFTNAQIQQATEVVRQKREQLNHWAAYANEAIDKEKQAGVASANAQTEAVARLAIEWEVAGNAIDKTTVKVKNLAGEVLTLEQYEKQQSAGGSFTYDLSSSAGVENYRKLNPGASINWSDAQIVAFIKAGGTLQQLIQQGVIDPYAAFKSGQNHASFAEGGYGDFGAGTLAMLHGKEIITPVDKLGEMGTVNHYWTVNGDGIAVARTVKNMLMTDVKFGRQLSALR